jgi:hypothetical protein
LGWAASLRWAAGLRWPASCTNAPACDGRAGLDVAERAIVDAESLVRVTDEFAESLRVPAGGRRTPAGRGVPRHVARVVLVVCLAALVILGALELTTGAVVPRSLTLSLFCASGAAGWVRALSRRS